MGSRGPAPKPTDILKIRGSRRVAQRRGEPQAESGAPKKPATLKGDAAKVWAQVCKILAAMGILTTADGHQLERYARLYVSWQRAQAVLDSFETPEAMAEAWGSDKSRPIIRNATATSLRLDTALKQIEASFGMTPSARARIGCLMNGGNPQSADPRENKYFGGGA